MKAVLRVAVRYFDIPLIYPVCLPRTFLLKVKSSHLCTSKPSVRQFVGWTERRGCHRPPCLCGENRGQMVKFTPRYTKVNFTFWLFATPWTAARQAPLSMGFSRPENWSGLPFPSPGDLPHPGIEAGSPVLQTILYHLSKTSSIWWSPGARAVTSWNMSGLEQAFLFSHFVSYFRKSELNHSTLLFVCLPESHREHLKSASLFIMIPDVVGHLCSFL